MSAGPRTKPQPAKNSSLKKAVSTTGQARGSSTLTKARRVVEPVGNAAAKVAGKPDRKAAGNAAPGSAAASVRSDSAKAARPAAAESAKKRLMLVRDSFTMPRSDFNLIDTLKQRALGFRRPTKKSELLRAGLHALDAMDAASLHSALDALVPLKAGRPKKSA